MLFLIVFAALIKYMTLRYLFHTCRFEDHLLHMFGPEVPPASWDLDKKYKPDNFLVWFNFYTELQFFICITIKKAASKWKGKFCLCNI
jgi:hypothetical protein